VSKSKGYWASDEIGVSGGGRGIVRLSNMYQAMGEGQRGLYLVARHHPGETPGSWLLDGFLRHLSMTGKKSLMTWAVPLCDADGVQRGRFRAHHAFAVSPERSALGDDVRRWRERCQPLLAISFEAAGAGDTQGLYCTAEGEAAAKWSNIFKDALRTGFAAPEFCRSAEPEPGVGAGVFHELGITAVTLHAPYALVGTSELVQKDYRQIGKRLAEAVLRRNGK
jgi:hypothetical protein